MSTNPIGSILWQDLTIDPAIAERVRGFYEQVAGWTSSPVDMGGYADHCMNQPADGKTVAGICQARGANAKVPPVWIVYITVASVADAVAKCVALGGELVDGPRGAGGGSMAVLRDPAGTVFGVYQFA